tara:strand:- start:694 stop:2157 length:1464 start_codon:yes stop_codon:yes gene_type:complete
MKDLYIKKYIWNKNDNNVFFDSLNKKLNIKNINRYIPILALYLYYHNTKKAHKLLDFHRKYYINEILEVEELKYYNSNMLSQIKLYNKIDNKITQTDCFIKIMPILDIIPFIKNNYNINNNFNLPNNYNYNTYSKINSLYNSSYIDTFFSLIVSELSCNNILPNFPKFYGQVNGIIDSFKYDITDEYEDICDNRGFNKNLGKLFSINIYKEDTESETDSETHSESEKYDTDSYSDLSEDNDYILNIYNFPVQLLFIEKLDNTLDKLFPDISVRQLISCYFQINYALIYLQKCFNFTHNDLHINNIMYKKTNKKFLYYKYNNLYFKVPTFGFIFYIIDFGRSIFTFKNKIFTNDIFSEFGDCEGQYDYPINNIELFVKNKIEKENTKINYSFDMCRLTTTILEEIENNSLFKDDDDLTKELFKFLNKILVDKNNEKIYNEDIKDKFDLYINISKYACNGIPKDLINHKLFKIFRIAKKDFPKKNFYKI